MKKASIILLASLLLTGCSVDEALQQGEDLINKGEELVKKGEELSEDIIEKGENAAATVNKATAALDGKIRKIQNKNVFEEPFTFKELIDATVVNPIWDNESGNYVTVQGKVNGTVEGYEGLDEIILGFPFSEKGLPLANAGVFTTIDGAVKIDGNAYEVSGEEVILLLMGLYEN